MRRLGLLLATALTLAAAGTAGADTFTVVPSSADAAPPTMTAPNEAGKPSATSFSMAPEAQVPLSTLREFWGAAGSAYGIPWQVLAAINKIESNFGRNQGPSSAGAIGWMQFMPATWLRWGVDANGDGIADPANPADAIYSAARYLAASGGQTNLPRAIFAYNHADWYVNEVMTLASLYGQGGAQAVFSLDRLQADVDASRKQLAELNVTLASELHRARSLARTENQLLRTAMTRPLVSDRLEARKRSVQTGLRRDAADQRVAQLRAELAAAHQALSTARDHARAAAFASAAAQMLSAPTYSGGYVFPVGGGPAQVSVSSGHHDYPAADIAAPEGAPVYTLADALVARAWNEPEGNCGIGATITTADGQTWTYCHLSYLEPSVHAGASLAAGTPLGLVGQTGDATGPHLHLQLDPTDAYPQDEPWFRAFSGTAFRWESTAPSRTLAAASPPAQPLFVQLDQPSVAFDSGKGEIQFSPDAAGIQFTPDVIYFTR